tara:strand:+ start:274 stop:1047 length:774 start_codon:yes stop_codon:yes gene_type:complete
VKEIIDYKNFVKKIGIKKTDKVLINSNFLKIMIAAKIKKKNFDLFSFIEAFLDHLGNKGTLLIPAYSWDFIKKKTFNSDKTRSISGSLANRIINHEKFKRTQNPIYSFLVAGKDQQYLCSLKHKDSFSIKSPFGYLIKNKGKNIFLDVDYKDSFTFVHLAEQKIGVKYRFKKIFTGYVIKASNRKKISTIMYSRKLDTGVKGTKIDKRFDNYLIKKNALKSKKISGIKCQIVDIKKAFNAMVKNLNSKEKFIYPIYK